MPKTKNCPTTTKPVLLHEKYIKDTENELSLSPGLSSALGCRQDFPKLPADHEVVMSSLVSFTISRVRETGPRFFNHCQHGKEWSQEQERGQG